MKTCACANDLRGSHRAMVWRPAVPPMFRAVSTPRTGAENRIVVSPMDMYSSLDGTPGDFLSCILGTAPLAVRVLVFTEMTCVTREGRNLAGMRRHVPPRTHAGLEANLEFVHASSRARSACSLDIPAQRLDEVAVGGDGRTARRGETGRSSRLRRSRMRPEIRRRPELTRAGRWSRFATPLCVPPHGPGSRLRHARAALRSRDTAFRHLSRLCRNHRPRPS